MKRAQAAAVLQLAEANYLEKTRQALRNNKAAQVIEELAGRLEAPEVPDEEAPVRRAHRYLSRGTSKRDFVTSVPVARPRPQ